MTFASTYDFVLRSISVDLTKFLLDRNIFVFKKLTLLNALLFPGFEALILLYSILIRYVQKTYLKYLQDPELKPREVHRGLDGLPEIPDGKPQLKFISSRKIDTKLKINRHCVFNTVVI